MTTMLANIFRYVLTSTEDKLIPLDHEIRFIKDYLAIEQMRFGERLEVEFDVDAAAKAMFVPPLILQPLVENALSHGLAPMIAGGRIRVAARCETGMVHLTVEDTGIGLSKSARIGGSGTRVGLSNTHKRLECLYGTNARLSLSDRPGGGARASITLPQGSIGQTP